MTLTLQINGKQFVTSCNPEIPLVYVLRNDLELKGSKIGCGLEQCGACAILVDGRLQLSCNVPVSWFEGREITTIEGLRENKIGKRVHDAFIKTNAAQCGYCTAGMVIAVTALLHINQTPTEDEIKTTLAPHICRCGAHPQILEAVKLAVTVS